jgi:hypothetical protein
MNKTRLRYFEQEDVLHLVISDEPESRSMELSPNITVELNDKNEMIRRRDLEGQRLSAGYGIGISSSENASTGWSRRFIA